MYHSNTTLWACYSQSQKLTHSNTITQVYTPTYSHTTVTPAHMVTCLQTLTYTHTHTPTLMHAYTCSHACTPHTHTLSQAQVHSHICSLTHTSTPSHTCTHTCSHSLLQSCALALPWESGGLTTKCQTSSAGRSQAASSG